ncbi:MAG: hypothetical protein EZS28_037410, partial [Streblomastix strix]
MSSLEQRKALLAKKQQELQARKQQTDAVQPTPLRIQPIYTAPQQRPVRLQLSEPVTIFEAYFSSSKNQKERAKAMEIDKDDDNINYRDEKSIATQTNESSKGNWEQNNSQYLYDQEEQFNEGIENEQADEEDKEREERIDQYNEVEEDIQGDDYDITLDE